MKNIYDVLRQKESDLIRVRGEIEALRFAIPLLAETDQSAGLATEIPVARLNQRNKWPLQVG